jgi:hypothetical protein
MLTDAKVRWLTPPPKPCSVADGQAAAFPFKAWTGDWPAGRSALAIGMRCWQ